MLLFKKIIYISLFFVSACGFTPVYMDSTSSKLSGQISIQEPDTQNEFFLYSRLIDRFGDMGNKYILSMKSYIKIDCNTYNLRVESLKSFDEPLGSGTMVSSEVYGDEWEIPKYGSIDSKINKYLCKNY